ncbi:hypothetical protein GGR52DRAFT_192998 [Hypoxylon sp. FL1284]|nr:hypothetical protein GGR52DRAFT_192998 [Hypoxylon sp. FL1284]
MPRHVETLDVALPVDHPLKRPVSTRNRQAAQRIYELWNVWPWQVFRTGSPHTPSTWTDNLLEKLKTIALYTTLPYALQLLKTNLADNQQLSTASLNAVIEACKRSNTPRNPVLDRKRKQDSTIVVEYGSDGYENQEGGQAEDASDDDDENDNEVAGQEARSRRNRPHFPSARRMRGKSLPNGYGQRSKSAAPPSKRQKHGHQQPSTPLYLPGNASSPALAPTSLPSPRPGSSLLKRFDSEGPPRPSSSGAVASHFEAAIGQLSRSIQEKFHGAEQLVDDARSQVRVAEAKLGSLESDLGDVKKDIAEIEQEKSDMENTYEDLLGIEKEEQELATRRRELMMRRATSHWRSSSVMATPSELPESQSSPSLTRASDDLLAEINALVAERLQPKKAREESLKSDISSAKSEIETAQAQVDASVVNLGSKSDELIRWRGFSSDVQDALVRRGFAELAYMPDFGQSQTTSQHSLYAGLPSTLYFSRVATASFPSELNRDAGLAGSPEQISTPVSQSARADRETGRRDSV